MFALLDLDETLVDRSSAFNTWADRFVERQTLSEVDRQWLSLADREHKQRGAFFEAVHERFPQSGAAEDLWNQYAAEMPTLAKVHDGVLQELSSMRAAGWALVVVTNGRQDNQEAKLHATGLAALVDDWVISGAVGVRKPEPEIFLHGLERLHAPSPRDVFMVGDDPTADIEPAMHLGLRTAWVAHRREWPLPTRPTLSAPTTAATLELVLRHETES